MYLPDQMNPSDDPSLSQKRDLYAAKISADYGKLLGPSSDVDCVKEWKDSAGQINAAKAAGKQTPDSPQQALPPRAKAGGSLQVIADEDDGWADGELVRMLDDDYVIDESLALDDYEFDLTLSEAEQADSGALSIGGAAFSISPEFIATLEPGDHTITLWVEGVDHDTQEPVGFVVEKQIQVVDFAGDRMSTEAMVYNGRYASMSIDGRENGGFGVCDGKGHELNITLKTPDRTDANGGIIEAGTTLVEGRDYNLMYYRVNGGETMALTNEIRAAGEHLIVAAPQEISDACFGMAYNVYKVEAPELADPDFVLPAGAMAVEDSAFEGSASINAVYVGDNCATIGESAFKDCEGLTQIRLPRFCVIGKDAFSGTPSLKAICAPTGLDDKAIANEDVEHMGSLADGTAEKWAADHNIPFVPIG